MSNKIALDKSRPYGEVKPALNGAHFEQGGIFFDHEGNPCEKHPVSGEPQVVGKPAPKPKAQQQPQQQQGSGQGNAGGGDAGSDAGGQGGGAAEGELNLALWLKGEADYPYKDVQNAVKARFSKWVTAKHDMVIFLVEEQKVVTAAELKPEFAELLKPAGQ